MITVSHLYVYPIKSLGGISLSSVNITDRGFEYDRRWMLIDERNNFLTQREFPVMALLQVEIVADGLKVFHKENKTDFIIIPFKPLLNERVNTNIWRVPCDPLLVSDAADKWFSAMLNSPCRLVYMDDDTQVAIDERYNINNSLTSFSDGFPILMISQASLQDLNSKATEQLPMNRFRPNIVISNANAYEEDTLKEFVINGITFYGAKPSARCVITTIDQNTTAKGKEPLKTLATYRSMNNKIYLGENVIADAVGEISVGNEIVVIERKDSLF
ncbi:MAG: MOSC N-terminal beta barrel domain-containing protein [Bacteroidota bacterium]